MNYMCIVPVAPLRAEASHRTEMVSQLLFGELCTVLEQKDEFVKVKCHYDDYEGWCQKTQLVEYLAEDSINQTKQVYIREATIGLNRGKAVIPFGAMVPHTAKKALEINGYHIDITGIGEDSFEHDSVAERLKAYANLYLNTGYLWGGKSVWGVDCSGFVQQLYKAVGIKLPRDAYQQAEVGELVGFLQEVQPGDLAFFDNEEGRITHVGMMLNEHSIIHSSGSVHVDPIDHAGIQHHITGKRTHRLRLIRRMLQ